MHKNVIVLMTRIWVGFLPVKYVWSMTDRQLACGPKQDPSLCTMELW